MSAESVDQLHGVRQDYQAPAAKPTHDGILKLRSILVLVGDNNWVAHLVRLISTGKVSATARREPRGHRKLGDPALLVLQCGEHPVKGSLIRCLVVAKPLEALLGKRFQYAVVLGKSSYAIGIGRFQCLGSGTAAADLCVEGQVERSAVSPHCSPEEAVIVRDLDATATVVIELACGLALELHARLVEKVTSSTR